MAFKYRILVVDDEPLVRKTAALVLNEQGYEVRTAEDGFYALMELREALPDIIVSDLGMPKHERLRASLRGAAPLSADSSYRHHRKIQWQHANRRNC